VPVVASDATGPDRPEAGYKFIAQLGIDDAPDDDTGSFQFIQVHLISFDRFSATLQASALFPH
jgi:hypothetical protein